MEKDEFLEECFPVAVGRYNEIALFHDVDGKLWDTAVNALMRASRTWREGGGRNRRGWARLCIDRDLRREMGRLKPTSIGKPLTESTDGGIIDLEFKTALRQVMTAEEYKVAALLAEGHWRKEIAEIMDVPVTEVAEIIERVKDKLDELKGL